MATTVGEIDVIAKLNSKDFDKGLDDIEKKTESTGSKMAAGAAKVGKAVAVGLTAATAAVAAIATSAVKSFAEYEQLTGGVETLFKDSSGIVMQYAENAYKTAGMSANQYMDTVTGFSASLLQGLSGDTAAAAKYADMAVTDMSDNANKMGTNIGMIQDAYQGFAKDNFTMLDNLKLGYGGTASEMARLVNDSGVMGASFKATAENVKDIPFDKLIESIHVVQSEMGITGTTAKEASETISGSIGTMKAAWSNMLVFLSGESNQTWDDAFGGLVESVQNVAKNLIPVIGQVLNGIADLIGELAPTLVKELPGLVQTIVPALVDAIVNIVTSAADVLPDLIVVLAEGALKLFMALVEVLPKILPQLLTSLVDVVIKIAQMLTQPDLLTTLLNASIQLFLALVKAIPQIITALAEALPEIISNIISFWLDPATMKMMIDGAVELFMALVKAVPQILSALIKAFGDMFGQLWDKMQQNFKDFAGNFGSAIGQVFKNAINGVLGFIEGFINGPIDLINSAIGAINKIPGVSIGKLPRMSLPRFADGGEVNGAGTGTSDSIHALLSNGEFVMRESSSRAIGADALNYMNQTGQVPNTGATYDQRGWVFNTEADINDIDRKMERNRRRERAMAY